MSRWNRRRSRLKSQAGLTLIELLIAGMVLVVGLLAVVGLFTTAIGNNGRSKVDSTSTMLAQSVIEQITAVLARGGPPSIADCGDHPATSPWQISTATGGAQLQANGPGIDFTESAPPAGYHMDYVVCPGAVKNTYDIRWNVQALSSGGTYLVIVGARPKNLPSTRFAFALPVTMRVYVGPQ